jgi:tRNA modification GTPase
VTLYAPSTQEVIDDGLLAVFHAPRSFTGEDVVEFQGHGGALVLGRVLEAFVQAGAQLARPGEFSERAFLSGKLDLTQAEAIADLVAARTLVAQRVARRQLSGALASATEAIATEIRGALARIEASIDFPEDVGEIDSDEVAGFLRRAQQQTERLLQTAPYGKRLTEGVTVAIIGRPNVGKSSLLNQLIGEERAIVSEIPGTTRDVVAESLNLGGIPVRLLDTAGIRETSDPIERIGVTKSEVALADADLVLFVIDTTTGQTVEDDALLARIPASTPRLILWNKADIARPPVNALGVSCKTGQGIATLHTAAAQALGGSTTVTESEALVTRTRHESALREAQVALQRALETLHQNLPAELIAVDAHAAITSLGAITGVGTREEVIAEIFATFCIGK